MPRQSASSPARQTPIHQTPTRQTPIHQAPIHQTPTIVQQAPTLGQTIKQGFGFGIGNAIAHRIFGSRKEPTPYEQCIAEHRDDAAVCAHLAQTK